LAFCCHMVTKSNPVMLLNTSSAMSGAVASFAAG
jgi:hypothetical protein